MPPVRAIMDTYCTCVQLGHKSPPHVHLFLLPFSYHRVRPVPGSTYQCDVSDLPTKTNALPKRILDSKYHNNEYRIEPEKEISVPIEDLMELTGILNGKLVHVLKDDGCSTNVTSREFVREKTIFRKSSPDRWLYVILLRIQMRKPMKFCFMPC